MGEKVYCCAALINLNQLNMAYQEFRFWLSAEGEKIATGLVNAMKSSPFLNHFLKDDEFAFSDPTLNGIGSASKFMKSYQFLVYNIYK